MHCMWDISTTALQHRGLRSESVSLHFISLFPPCQHASQGNYQTPNLYYLRKTANAA
jgi:hypothetical protein